MNGNLRAACLTPPSAGFGVSTDAKSTDKRLRVGLNSFNAFAPATQPLQHHRPLCFGLFEKFVGPMLPVLSQAIRMLIGREDINLERLAQAAEAIQADPSIMQALADDEPASILIEEGLVREHTAVLLSALDGTTIKVAAEANSTHRIGQGPLRIAAHPSAVERDFNAGCVDGLDDRQWAIVLLPHPPRSGNPRCGTCTGARPAR
jgi:hypothetical protein